MASGLNCATKLLSLGAAAWGVLLHGWEIRWEMRGRLGPTQPPCLEGSGLSGRLWGRRSFSPP